MRLTFGKFEGWDTEDLAKAGDYGRSYLVWCAENLKSPKWRAECERALGLGGFDEALTAKALVQDSGDIGFEEALFIVRENRAAQEEDDKLWAAVEDAQEKVISEYAGKMEVPVNKLRQIFKRYEFGGWEELPASKFSSQEKYRQFIDFMQAVEAASSTAYHEARGY